MGGDIISANTDEKKAVLAFKDNQVTQVKGKVTKKDICTEMQSKIITYVASMVREGDTSTTPYRIKVSDFIKMIDDKQEYVRGGYYDLIKRSLYNLRKLGIELTTITEDTNEVVVTQLGYILKSKYYTRQGFIELFLYDEMIEFYTKYDNNFTKINIKNMMKLKGKYAVPVYEFLLSWRGAKKFICTIEDIRKALGIEAKRYKETRNFLTRCLYPSIKEINDKTELIVNLKSAKTYRQEVKEIEFSLKMKTEMPRIIGESEQLLLDNGISPETAKNLALNNSQEKIQGNYHYLKEKIANNKIPRTNNIAGLLITAIKDDWANIESDLFCSNLEKELSEKKEKQKYQASKLEEIQLKALEKEIEMKNKEHDLSTTFAKKIKK